jgi:hypothetical protein
MGLTIRDLKTAKILCGLALGVGASTAANSPDLLDGSGVFGLDPYATPTQVFRDFGDVWLQIEIDPPRRTQRSKC